MATYWITAVGVIIVWVLIFFSSSKGTDLLHPWETYHRAFNDAQAARGRFLQSGFVAATRSLKDRICCNVRKLHIPICPLCGAAR